MEKLIVSPGFVKKIEDEQDTQDQAITSNSTAITKLNVATGISDCNSAITTGLYKAPPGTTNQPYQDYNVIYVFGYNEVGADIAQLSVGVNNRRMFFRTRKDGTTWMSWQELATTDIETITPTINSTYIASGTVKCVVKGGWAFVSGENVVFKMAGNSQQGVVTGLPKPALQVNGKFGGSNATTTAQIDAAGDSLWINQNQSSLNVHLGSTYNSSHWFSISYPVG